MVVVTCKLSSERQEDRQRTWWRDRRTPPHVLQTFLFSYWVKENRTGRLCHLLFICRNAVDSFLQTNILIWSKSLNHSFAQQHKYSFPLSLTCSIDYILTYSPGRIHNQSWIRTSTFAFTFRTSIDTFLQLNSLIFLLLLALNIAATLHNAYDYKSTGYTELTLYRAILNQHSISKSKKQSAINCSNYHNHYEYFIMNILSRKCCAC